MGSTILATDGNGTVANRQGYTAYGEKCHGDDLLTDHQFTGQKLDATGLLYYQARYYDPAVGQFLSPDTLVPDATVIGDYNRYLYSRANPLKYSDPTGHCATLTDGTADWQGDGDCWGLAYSIYGLGANTEQEQFANDWRVSPDAWLQDIAAAGFATTEYLQPFYDKYRGSFNGRTGLTQGRPNEGAPPPDVFNELVKVYGAGLLKCAQAIQGACGVSYGGTGIVPGAAGRISGDLYADSNGTLALFGTLGGGVAVMLFPQPIVQWGPSVSAFPSATVHDLEGFSVLVGGTAGWGKGVSVDLVAIVYGTPWGTSGGSANGIFNAEAHFMITHSWLLYKRETR